MNKVPNERQMKEAWEFVQKMREEWTEEDWADFYHGISFGLFRIAQRHKREKIKPNPADFQI